MQGVTGFKSGDEAGCSSGDEKCCKTLKQISFSHLGARYEMAGSQIHTQRMGFGCTSSIHGMSAVPNANSLGFDRLILI